MYVSKEGRGIPEVQLNINYLYLPLFYKECSWNEKIRRNITNIISKYKNL